ncbi:hypothetical protein [Acidovorax sp. A79]|uniref:hypothetical protein n=1 Tax=Acidovorax sp. A79 TaxID=3056107 RepID=UPI0034E8B15A
MFLKSAVFLALLTPFMAFSQIGVEMPASPPPETSGPTLEQTVDWIIKKLNAVPHPTSLAKADQTYPPHKVRATGEGCRVRISFSYANAYKTFEFSRSFNYKDLNPKAIKVVDYEFDGNQMVSIYAETLGDKRVIEHIDDSRIFMSWQLEIANMLIDVEYGESLKNAIIHAQKLCAQKASADKPPKAKDLF